MLLVASCTEVGPDYVRPSAPGSAAYKEASPQIAAHPETAIAGKWWEIYGDTTLDALVSQVAISNQSLAAAAARVGEAQALVAVAHGAALPAISAGTLKSGRKNENDFGIGVSWELDLWGRIRRDVEAHRALAEASSDDLAAATLSMQAQLVQSYFALRQDDAVIDLLQRAADGAGQWNRMVGNQYTQGQASSANVAEAAMKASSAQLQLADTKSARAELEHAIAVMLGKPPAEFSIAIAPFDANVPIVPSGVPASLLERRPDVAASERRMAAASARIGVAKAETLPSINLAAGIGILRGPTGTADVRAPLFAGGRLDAQITNADEGYKEAVANYRQTVLDAYREVEDGLVVTSTLACVAELQAKAATAATESDRVTQNQYKEGVADYPAVVDAANAALDAGRGEQQLRLRRLDASVNLIMSLGGGWQPNSRQNPKR
ncbi:efflux transporter outer membrane subunit [Rhodanobacter sp. L36]|uniref:efflux transporter outer membrane subunit n=1 Tax=Rhodanobacter sp. L36 TaxID=1747221 RepID=UPI00131DC793|nr:efflux transporter outer membrane subunit [Rhodanobacter sp. L36]